MEDCQEFMEIVEDGQNDSFAVEILESPYSPNEYEEHDKNDENYEDFPLNESGFSSMDVSISSSDETEDSIKSSPTKSVTDPLPNLLSVTSLTKTSVLPVCKVSNNGCEMINVHTVAKLLRGKYTNSNISLHLIDCRYPYEYNAGHITSAVNCYTCSDLLEKVFSSIPIVDEFKSSEFNKTEEKALPVSEGDSSVSPRQVIVFYCEFSSQRGPKMQQFLRSVDRTLNRFRYPRLYYPHAYLMMGGYEAFYANYPELCEPRGYLKMYHRDLTNQLHYFSKMTAEVHRVCTECIRELEVFNFEFMKEENEREPVLKHVQIMPTGNSIELIKINTETPFREEQSEDVVSTATIIQSLQLLEHIIRAGRYVIQEFERQNGLHSDSSTSGNVSDDSEMEHRPFRILSFSEEEEEE